MARLPYLDEKDLAEADKDLLKRPINLHRILTHSPEAARHFGGVGSYIRFGSTLDSRLRELAILQVGYLTKSPYEYSHHLKIGRDFGTEVENRKMITQALSYRPVDEPPLRERGRAREGFALLTFFTF